MKVSEERYQTKALGKWRRGVEWSYPFLSPAHARRRASTLALSGSFSRVRVVDVVCGEAVRHVVVARPKRGYPSW